MHGKWVKFQFRIFGYPRTFSDYDGVFGVGNRPFLFLADGLVCCVGR